MFRCALMVDGSPECEEMKDSYKDMLASLDDFAQGRNSINFSGASP